jgi:malate synthase
MHRIQVGPLHIADLTPTNRELLAVRDELHSVITRDEILASRHRMAPIVDRKNADDPAYEPLAVGEKSLAFCAARDLILLGTQQPNGYTESILHHYRHQKKEYLS